jgi:hypothetical protein
LREMVLDVFHLDFFAAIFPRQMVPQRYKQTKLSNYHEMWFYNCVYFCFILISNAISFFGLSYRRLPIGILLGCLHRLQFSVCSKRRNKLMIVHGVITLKTIIQLMNFFIFWTSISTKPTFESHSWRNTDVKGSFHYEL